MLPCLLRVCPYLAAPQSHAKDVLQLWQEHVTLEALVLVSRSCCKHGLWSLSQPRQWRSRDAGMRWEWFFCCGTLGLLLIFTSSCLRAVPVLPQIPVPSAVELEAEPLVRAGLGLVCKKIWHCGMKAKLRFPYPGALYTHSQQKSSEELQSRAECEKDLLILQHLLEMPEGPSVRKFQLLISPFVGQVVAKVGGSSRKLNVNDLNALRLQDSQVHGKNLYLAFVAAEGPFGPTAEGTVLQREAACGAHCPAQGGQGQVGAPHSQDKELQELQHSRAEAPDGAEGLGNWLHIHFGMFGSVRANEFSRANRANKRGDWKDPVPRLVLHFESGGFLVFYNCRMLWCSSPRADPASDILSVQFLRGQALRALCAPNPICYTLLDQRYFSGLGNIIKNEILYLARIHPLTPGSLLALSDLEHLLDCAVQFSSEWLHNKLRGQGLHPHVYQKEQCPLGHPLMKGTFGPSGGLKRPTWWCPECQPAVLPRDEDPSPVTE